MRQDCPARQQFLRKIEQLMSKLVTYAPVDSAADQMAKKYIHDSLPPVLTESTPTLLRTFQELLACYVCLLCWFVMSSRHWSRWEAVQHPQQRRALGRESAACDRRHRATTRWPHQTYSKRSSQVQGNVVCGNPKPSGRGVLKFCDLLSSYIGRLMLDCF